MGAVIKGMVTRDIVNGRILSQSGLMESPRDVAEHVEAHFMYEEWRTEHANRAINEICVAYSHHNEISEHPSVEHEFEPLTGKMTSYSFMMFDPGQFCRRSRSCWCEAC